MTGIKTTLIGIVVIITGIIDMFLNKSITAEGSAIILAGIGLILAKDESSPNNTNLPA
jgi:uncharacterized membrane protein